MGQPVIWADFRIMQSENGRLGEGFANYMGQGFQKSWAVPGGTEGTRGAKEVACSLPRPLLTTSAYSFLQEALWGHPAGPRLPSRTN